MLRGIGTHLSPKEQRGGGMEVLRGLTCWDSVVAYRTNNGGGGGGGGLEGKS